MNIEANKKRRIGLGVAVAVIAGWTTWLAAVPGPGTGHSFTSLQSGFTQDLYATTGTGGIASGAILGGVAFAPDGRVWSAECSFLGTRLHRFASATTSANGSSVHDEELIVDLTEGGPLGIDVGGCGLVNHPDGSMYSSSTAGIWQLNATTGHPVAGPFGHGANALGIAVDPQAGHHLVYVGNDCHPTLAPEATTCTLWDLDPVTHTSLVFARLTRAELMLIDGIYFDPSGNFVFAAHRQVEIDDFGFRTDHNSLQIIRRPAALKPATTPVDDTQSRPLIPMASEPDGVAFHAGDGFVVTLNESGDCVNGASHIVASDPNTGSCPAETPPIQGTTMPIGGTMTRFDFATGYAQPPTAVTTFASGGFRGDLTQVGPDGCIYATQAPLFANGGTHGTRYDNDVTTGDNSIVQICGGFVTPPGVTTQGQTLPGSIAGLVFLDANHNGVRDSGDGALAGVPVTLSTDPTHPVTSATNGTFLFEALAPGTYTVTTPATATYLGGSVLLSTAGSSGTISLAAGEDRTGFEFGYAPGSIAGTTFHDLNQNTVWDDALEPPLGGVTVTLTGAAGGSAISAADGSYKFNLLTSGDYTVTVPATAGTLALTTVGSRTVTLAPGEDRPDVDFGYALPLTIACLSPATGQVGVAYSGSAVASGGVGPYTYAIEGTLPAGLALDASSGQISGTPTATGSFSVTVTDSNGAGASTATSACSVTIAPAAPTLACVAATTGQVGVAYSSSLLATGGVGPYTYSIISGSLPTGLTLNASTGAITGTPTVAGSPSFTAQVVDARGTAAGTTSNSSCGITIGAAAPAGGQCAGAIGDFVWVDLNRNGRQDAGEPGKGSVALTLKTPSGGVLATTATSSSGLYQFGGLCTGAYVVEMTVPAGFDQTGVGAGSNPALDSNASPATVILATDTSADLTIDFGVVNGFCEKQPVQTELNPTGTHFPGNKGPDAIVRMQHGQRLQEAVDQAADVNGDGYIIVGVVAVDGGLLGGHVSQRVVVNRTYPLPFALIGCSVTLHDPNPGEGQPTGRVLASASAPPDGIGARIFIMDVHAEDSGVAGWLVEGNNRYLRNVYGKRNAVGIRFVGNSNTMHNGSVEENQGHGLVIEGNSNTVTDTNAFSNLGHGVSVSGSGNQILKVDAGDKNKGNGGDGVHAAGAGNLLSEIDTFANGGDGVEIVASAGSPNIVKKARSGDTSGKGNAGNGILVSGPGNGAANPIELEENTVKANGLVGIRVLGGGHQLKKNISGGTASGEMNVGCEFLAASGNMNATGNKANGVTVAGANGSVFPTTCVGS